MLSAIDKALVTLPTMYKCMVGSCPPLHRLYVVSVDGVLSALDWDGHPVWSYQLAQPLFSSTLNYKVNNT